MQLDLFSTKTIREIQAEFTGAFPFLRIEFLDEPEAGKKEGCSNHCCKACMQLGDLVAISPGQVDIDTSTRTFDLETVFKNQFGLTIQINKNTGNGWTRAMGLLTEQNESAERSQQMIHPSLDEPVEEREY